VDGEVVGLSEEGKFVGVAEGVRVGGDEGTTVG
jgi:hypothetical protein